MKTIFKLLALLLVVAGCSQERLPAHVNSPDAKLTLVASRPQDPNDREYGCLVFDIRDASGRVLCHKNTGAKARGFTIYWPSNDEVDIYCSDIGTQHWKRQADGSWKK